MYNSGTSATTDSGVAATTSTSVATHVATVARKPSTDSGRLKSIVSWSLAKRFRMRPIGVVSKNAIGARKIDCNKPRCSARALRIAVNAIRPRAVPYTHALMPDSPAYTAM